MQRRYKIEAEHYTKLCRGAGSDWKKEELGLDSKSSSTAVVHHVTTEGDGSFSSGQKDFPFRSKINVPLANQNKEQGLATTAKINNKCNRINLLARVKLFSRDALSGRRVDGGQPYDNDWFSYLAFHPAGFGGLVDPGEFRGVQPLATDDIAFYISIRCCPSGQYSTFYTRPDSSTGDDRLGNQGPTENPGMRRSVRIAAPRSAGSDLTDLPPP